MNLTFSENFTSEVTLDSQLTGTPDSGMRLSGAHPTITVQNLLDVLPEVTYTFGAYAAGTTYGKFETSRLRTDIVLSGGLIYQSISASNIGNTPASSPTKWLETNIESLRLRAFIYSIEDKVKTDLRLNNRLVDSQDIYNVGDTAGTPSGDFVGWAFEPKGSDYVRIEINQMSCQATTTDAQSIYVINQGVLIDTITLTPINGKLAFEDVNYIFKGAGVWRFVMAAREMKLGGSYVDPLRFSGFTAYTTTGTGVSAAASTYTNHTQGNGLGFNVSAYLDSSQYVTNNLKHYGEMLLAAFNLQALTAFLHNAYARNNTVQKNLMSKELLIMETQDSTSPNTAISKYEKAKNNAINEMKKTFDSALSDHSFKITKTTP